MTLNALSVNQHFLPEWIIIITIITLLCTLIILVIIIFLLCIRTTLFNTATLQPEPLF